MKWDPNNLRLVISFVDSPLLAVLNTRYVRVQVCDKIK
jgi:hypothetical protein